MKALLSGLLALVYVVANAQSNSSFIGSWSGTLNVGIELRIVFHIKETAAGGLFASADSPDQSAYGLKCDTIIISSDQLSIEMRALRASFSGKLLNDSTIDGMFKQGTEVPLTLTKGEKIAKRNRPQTPRPPFSYKSEEVEYDNADKSLHYGATITIPPGKGPFPAVILITGSGPQNRDEEIIGHKPFAVIADAFAKKGIVVLRVDDRGTGKSTGKFQGATTADFANDVETSLNYLLSRSEADKNRIGLVGHSEGGMIAPMVAAKRKEVSFIILLAGPGEKIVDLMTEQNVAILISQKTSNTAANAYGSLYKQIAPVIVSSADSITATNNAKQVLNKWINSTDIEIIRQLGFSTEKQQQDYIKSMVESLSEKWFKYFLSFDPAVYLQQLHCKVLALNGDKDVQVLSASNLAAIQASLKKSRSKTYEVKELPGLNHLFQHCSKCTLQEYGELEETFAPEVLTIMTDWIDKNVK